MRISPPDTPLATHGNPDFVDVINNQPTATGPCDDYTSVSSARDALVVTETKAVGTDWCDYCTPPKYLHEQIITTTRVINQAEYNRLTEQMRVLEQRCNNQTREESGIPTNLRGKAVQNFLKNGG